MSEMRFDDRVVVVTGAGNGVGRAHALLFAARGAKVIVNDLGGSTSGEGSDKSAADLVVDEIKAAGGEATANYDSVVDGGKIVQCAMDTYGGIDVLINNAGILRDMAFHKMTEESWDIIYDVHLKGIYATTHAAWPIMREKGFGRLIFTTSASGIYGNFGQTNYCAAKLGTLGFANALSIEGAKKNIMVNTIAPIAGSRLVGELMPDAIKKIVKPDLISPLVMKLCDENSTETGGLYEVGIGWFAKLRWERAQGLSLDLNNEITPEAVEAEWDKVVGFEDSEHPKNVQDAGKTPFKNMQRA